MISEKINRILQEKGSTHQTHPKRNVQPLNPPRSVLPKGSTPQCPYGFSSKL
jgi:hypothetical protein